MKLNPEFKARWIAALRSGEYAQGQGSLLNVDNELCCLGVGCRISDPELDIFGKAMPPRSVAAKWFGVPEESLRPSVTSEQMVNANCFSVAVGDQQHNLASLNDDGWSFKEIADLIEQQL